MQQKNGYEIGRDIVMKSRKELVDKLVAQMEKGGAFTSAPWENRNVSPYNPVSGFRYTAGNRLRLMIASLENRFTDPRWMTFKQASANDCRIKAGSKSVLLEKWITTNEVELLDEDGKPVFDRDGRIMTKTVSLKKPLVSYFRVFNAEQIIGLPALEPKVIAKDELTGIADTFEKSSRCPILHEPFQNSAFYSAAEDKIHLPPVESFKSSGAHLSVLLHEMAHSTGHESCFNRNLKNSFGTPDYAREELNAELSSYFIQGDLGVSLKPDSALLADHSNYIKSWISLLRNKPDELFFACSHADKISGFLMERYSLELEKKQALEQTPKAEQSLDDNGHYLKTLRADMKKNGLRPTSELLDKIEKLNGLMGSRNSLKDLNLFYKTGNIFPSESEGAKLVHEIGDSLKAQQLQNNMAMEM